MGKLLFLLKRILPVLPAILAISLLALWVCRSCTDVKKIIIYSHSLGKNMKVNVYLPPDYKPNERYPVLYLLHGKDGNEDSWLNGFFGINGLHVDRVADEMIKEKKLNPLVIVSPEIDNSYGVNSSHTLSSKDGFNQGMYEDYIIKDLIPYIDSHYQTKASGQWRYIAGISMGGFAALHTAFVHHDMFSKVGGYSAAMWVHDIPTDLNLGWLYPNQQVRNDLDPLVLAKTEKLTGLDMDLAHGDMDHDWLQASNRVLYQELDVQGILVHYTVTSGGHDYGYWSAHVQDYLLFFARK